jgi:hypothetical protein
MINLDLKQEQEEKKQSRSASAKNHICAGWVGLVVVVLTVPVVRTASLSGPEPILRFPFSFPRAASFGSMHQVLLRVQVQHFYDNARRPSFLSRGGRDRAHA